MWLAAIIMSPSNIMSPQHHHSGRNTNIGVEEDRDGGQERPAQVKEVKAPVDDVV
jgi:hypothetical protein